MSVVALILFIVAAVLFFVAGRTRVTPDRLWDLVPIGLGVLTVGFIIQFCSNSRTVHF